VTDSDLQEYVDEAVRITVVDPAGGSPLKYAGMLRYDPPDGANAGFYIVETSGAEEEIGPFTARDVSTVERIELTAADASMRFT